MGGEVGRAGGSKAARFRAAATDLLVVAAPLTFLYLRTASPDLGTIDSGELAAVCARLGIAHPTGYPLYTLLGRLAVESLPVAPIRAVTLLSAVIAVAVALAVSRLAREVLEDPGLAGGPWRPWIARAAGLWFATSAVFWDQATGNEVYGLHLLFVALLARQGIRILRPRADARDLLITAWIVGLAFSHHLSIVFVLPAMLFAVACSLLPRSHPGGRGWSPRLLLAAALVAALGWSIEFYLPIRASRSPLLDWGAPDHWREFWRHAMAAQYRVWLFESGRLWIGNLFRYLSSIPGRLFWPVLLPAPAGAIVLFRRERRVFWFLLLVWGVTLAWAASYDIHDIAPYFLPADLVLVLWSATGAAWALPAAARAAGAPEGRRVGTAGVALALALAGVQAGVHFRRADQGDDHFVRVHAEAVLRSLPEDTILITRHWDALVSPLLYLQGIEGERRDVTVVDTELLRRSWYFPQLRRWDPGLLRPLEGKVASFLQQLVLFEANRPYDPSAIENRYRAVMAGIAQEHRPERPTAFTPDEEPTFAGSCFAIPEGLVFVLRDRPEDSPRLDPPDTRRLLSAGYHPEDPVHRQIAEAWARMIEARIRYLTDMKRTGEIPAWEAARQDVRRLLAR